MPIDSSADGGVFADLDQHRHLRNLLGVSEVALARAAAAMTRLESEMAAQRNPITGESRALSIRLVDVSRTLQQAGQVLDRNSQVNGPV